MCMGLVMLRQTEIRTVEPLVLQPSTFEAVEEWKGHISPGIDHVPASLIKAGIGIILSEISKLMSSVWIKEVLPEEWKDLIILCISKKAIKQVVVIIGAYYICQLHTKLYPTSCCEGSTPNAEEIIVNHQYGFWRSSSTTDCISCIYQMLETTMGIHRSSSLTVNRLQEILWFTYVRGLV